MSLGRVWLVGAGPGDPGPPHGAGRRLLEAARTPWSTTGSSAQGVLDLIPPGALRLDVGKTGYGPAPRRRRSRPRLIRLASARASTVVRLKGGDPFVFGRGGEEAEALRDAGIPFDVVPGVTAGIAAPALAGIPVTHRGMARSVAFVTATTAVERQPDGPAHDWAALARSIRSSCTWPAGSPSVARRLLDAGRHPDTPAALIIDASLPSEKVRVTDLASLAGSDGATNERARRRCSSSVRWSHCKASLTTDAPRGCGRTPTRAARR